eukprot:8865777-Pyramimonas_sp.AAC.1
MSSTERALLKEMAKLVLQREDSRRAARRGNSVVLELDSKVKPEAEPGPSDGLLRLRGQWARCTRGIPRASAPTPCSERFCATYNLREQEAALSEDVAGGDRRQ